MGGAKTACLTASLLDRKRWPLAEELLRNPGSDGPAAMSRPATPPATIFLVKNAAAAEEPLLRLVKPAPLAGFGRQWPRSRPAAPKFSLRLTPERHERMKAAAARLGQSCQRFLLEALDARLARVSTDPREGVPA